MWSVKNSPIKHYEHLPPNLNLYADPDSRTPQIGVIYNATFVLSGVKVTQVSSILRQKN